MRVLHLHSGNLYGGIETMLRTLARYGELAAPLENQFALCFEGRLSTELRNLGAHPHLLGPVRLSRPWTVWRVRQNLQELIRRERFNAIVQHSVWSRAVFGGIGQRLGATEILWLHEAPQSENWLDRWALRQLPDHVICNSQHTQDRTTPLLRGTPSRVFYCPIEICVPQPSSAEQVRGRAELGIPPQAVVLIQASRMQKWKGHLAHLKTLTKLTSLPWFSLQVGGPQRPAEWTYFQSLQAETRRLGLSSRVRFLGQRSDVASLLGLSHVYFQPNQSPEPFGLSFVEAMFAGLPVVTTDMGGAREIVTPRVGKLVAPGDEIGLVDALAGLIKDENERQRLGSNARAQALTLCDPARQLPRLRSTVEEILSGCDVGSR